MFLILSLYAWVCVHVAYILMFRLESFEAENSKNFNSDTIYLFFKK